MTKRVIFSLYIDIPTDEIDYQPPHKGDTECKNVKAKREFMNHYHWLKDSHKKYAEHCGVDYKFFEYDEAYRDFEELFRSNYPQITKYNIINFYKIDLMYRLAKEYDEILYLDLDVVPFTNENFFESHDLSMGHVIKVNELPILQTKLPYVKKLIEENRLGNHSIRSPFAKHWNAMAMMFNEGCVQEFDGAFNTGIVGITKEQLEEIDYFGEFAYTLGLMDEMLEEELWPMRECFGYDNETIWQYKLAINAVDYQMMDDKWHYFMDRDNIIFPSAKFVHVINKNFDFVKERYEALDL